MKKKMMRHIQTVSDMVKSCIPYTFISEFGEEKCRQVSAEIMRRKVNHIVGEMSEVGKKYFMEDIKILSYLKQMEAVLDDTAFSRLESMLQQTRKEKLSDISCQDIQEVLLDESVPVRVQYNFLRYFKPMELTDGERMQLFTGLEKFRASVSISMAQFTEEERNILINPLFTSRLLDYLWDTREVWTMLIRPGVLPLLQRISEAAFSYQHLDDSQFRQIAENPEEIRQLLEKALECFADERYPDFLERWIENDNLLRDLKRLSNVLPDMDEGQKEKILRSRLAYVCSVYNVRMDGIDMEILNYREEDVLLYAIAAGKKHFLALVNENSEDFLAVRSDSLLLDPDVYRTYLNLNTLNGKNLRDSYSLAMVYSSGKEYLDRKAYTFEELKTLAPLPPYYYQLYGFLTNRRSDERLRILRELVKRDCVFDIVERGEDTLKRLARRLSEKPLSMWMQEEFGHIKDLKAKAAVKLLADWEDYQKFIPGIKNERQASYLIRGRKALSGYGTLEEFQENMLQDDAAWRWLREKLSVTDEFVETYRENIRQFVYNGEAEIVYQFCKEERGKREEVRRLLSAELMGEFSRLKYHEADLEKEIAYPVSQKTECIWKENLTKSMGDFYLWEEDRFIPVLQIGEIPMHTCISYKDGLNKSCLLSCFDANKKVLYLKMGDATVFRALLRLTKGSMTAQPVGEKKIEFADLTKEESVTDREGEELVLFLERPYFSGISEKKENEVVSLVYQMVREKAEKLHARMVISRSYAKYEASEPYERKDYYVYISASKNGNQYLDSLGGEATVSDSGLYGKNQFLMEKEEKTEKAA